MPEDAFVSSPEYEVLKVSCCDQSMSVVHRAAPTIAVKAYALGPNDLVGSIGVICK